MNIYVRGIDIISFYDFLLDVGYIPTVCFFPIFIMAYYVCEGRLVYWVQTSSLCEMMRPCAIHQISAQNYILVKFKFNIQYGGLVHHIFSQVLPKKTLSGLPLSLHLH
jgi:hypothetical protein